MPPLTASSVAETRPLSYAERAKKAQNIKSPITPHSFRTANPPPTVSNPVNTPATTTTNTPPTSEPNYVTSDSPPAPIIVEPDPSPPVPQPGPDPASDLSVIKTVNGNPSSNKDLASAALSIVVAHTSMQKPSPPPPVNVWSVRKMAQAQHQQSQAKSPSSSFPSPNTPSSKSAPHSAIRPVATAHDIDSPMAPRRPPDSRNNGNTQQFVPKAREPVNGVVHPSSNDSDDPFVVRVYAQSLRGPPQPPSIDDTESWPEVGKVPPNGSHSNQGTSAPETLREKDGEGNDTRENAATVTAKKSEKTKWVQIPVEELQATADAIHSSMRQSHSRNHSQHSHSVHRQGGNSRTNNPSSSGSGSVQGQSRTQSGRNSMSHSQAQSQAGSVHSSPRHINRGRRLPNEEPTGGNGLSAAAVEVIDHNSPLIQSGTVPAGPLGFSPQAYGPGPEQLASGAAYYPNISQAVPMQPFPQDLRQRMGQSTLLGTFNGPGDFPSIASAPPPSVQPQQGYPNVTIQPYPMYPPFVSYDHAQPLVYYGSRQHSPSYQPSLLYPQPPSGELQPQLPSPLEKPENTGTGYNVAAVSADGKPFEDPTESHERRMKAVVFGSIGLPGSSKGPSPSPRPADEKNEPVVERDSGSEMAKVEKAFPSFSIGVAPGEPGPSRLKASKMRRRIEAVPARIVSDAPIPTADVCVGEVKEKGEERKNETKWAFGTIKSPVRLQQELDTDERQPPTGSEVGSSADAPPAPLAEPLSSSPVVVLPGPQHPHVQTSGIIMQSAVGQLASPINGLPMAAPFPMQRTTIPLLATDTRGRSGGSEWEVKDFGYGFGHGGYAPVVSRDDRLAREAEIERGRLERELVEVEREKERERDGQRDREFTGRPRRGSYGGGYSNYERGSFGGRRGRGNVNGGYGGNGRGYNGRGGRGGYQAQQHQQRQQPFTTPPPQFQPLSPHSDSAATYYTPRQPLTTYVPTTYDAHQAPPPLPSAHPSAPPVPVPLSTLSFPLDPVRMYLLGQLEYYLSPQNMAQDFFLRQRMDSRGWIPISLIASFNRVRWLTTDPLLVREVLVLSTMVEVNDDYVRMFGWEQFVLPDAARSTVENPAFAYLSGDANANASQDAEEEVDGDGEAEEDEEEEVVFVMDREAESWSPERRQF